MQAKSALNPAPAAGNYHVGGPVGDADGPDPARKEDRPIGMPELILIRQRAALSDASKTSTLRAVTQVSAVTAGRTSALPEVVFLPGLGNLSYLDQWVAKSTAWTKITVLDLPGWRHGRASSCPPTIEGIASAATRWLEDNDKRDLILLGHSSGAQSAIRVAVQVPERLTGLVLAGPVCTPDARSVIRA